MNEWVRSSFSRLAFALLLLELCFLQLLHLRFKFFYFGLQQDYVLLGLDLVRDAPFARCSDSLDKLEESTFRSPKGRRFPFLSSLLPLFFGDEKVDGPFVRSSINSYGIPVFHKSNGATDLRLRSDMSNAEPVTRLRQIIVERQSSVEKGWGVSFELFLTQSFAPPSPLAQETYLPPENLPSVSSATQSPKPAPMIAEVGVSISGKPGPPFGPS